jgi:hypothetical protein
MLSLFCLQLCIYHLSDNKHEIILSHQPTLTNCTRQENLTLTHEINMSAWARLRGLYPSLRSIVSRLTHALHRYCLDIQVEQALPSDLAPIGHWSLFRRLLCREAE